MVKEQGPQEQQDKGAVYKRSSGYKVQHAISNAGQMAATLGQMAAIAGVALHAFLGILAYFSVPARTQLSKHKSGPRHLLFQLVYRQVKGPNFAYLPNSQIKRFGAIGMQGPITLQATYWWCIASYASGTYFKAVLQLWAPFSCCRSLG